MRWITALLALFLVPQLASGKASDLKTVVKGGNQFAFDLYARTKSGQSKKPRNIFFSPYSISTALAMTYAGAKGKTASQMARVLHLTLPQKSLHPAFNSLLKATSRSTLGSGNTLTVANALWGQRGYKFLDSFLTLTRSNYGAGLKEVDYINDREGARQTINRWVEGKTKRKIKNLIPEGVLVRLTRLVLTNAIYFKGTWTMEFDKKKTRDQPFHLLGGGKTTAPLMHLTTRFGYLDGGDFQALELPYRGKKITMVVLLPRTVKGLAGLEKKLSARWLEQNMKSLRTTKVKVYLPRFKAASAFMLGKTLKSMGMPLAFSDLADFSGMTLRKDLKISKVIHKAFVDVNEKGTEAAAATAVVMKLRGRAHGSKPIFRADRPFIFLIRDKTTGSVLFLGRLLDPRR